MMETLEQYSALLIYLLPLVLLALGLVAGVMGEALHLKDLDKREAAMRLAVPTSVQLLPKRPVRESFLAAGSVVMSGDVFKAFVASFRKLIGGRIGVYEPLMERARREAMLRMREQAAVRGAQFVFNVRMETSTISDPGGENPNPRVEILCYGTAVVFEK